MLQFCVINGNEPPLKLTSKIMYASLISLWYAIGVLFEATEFMCKKIMSHSCSCLYLHCAQTIVAYIVRKFGRFNIIFQDNLLIIRCLCVIMIMSVKILGQMIIPFEKWVMILTRFTIMKSQQSTTEALTALYMK